MIRIILLCATLLISACATAPPLAPEEKAYLERVSSAPTSFTIPEEEIGTARGRAERFISMYGAQGLMISTANVVQSGPALKRQPGHQYRVLFDGAHVSVRCWLGLGAVRGYDSPHNGRMLAHYIKTGEIYPRLLRW